MKRKAGKKAQAKEYGFQKYKSDSKDEGIRKVGSDISFQDALPRIASIAAASKALASMLALIGAAQLLPNAGLPISLLVFFAYQHLKQHQLSLLLGCLWY